MIKAIVILSILAMVSVFSMIELTPENDQYLVLWGYLILSFVTFGMYAFDKSASRNGRWRVPENNLHALALFGGWPGAMLGQRILRHKTVKQPFRFIFWLTVVINCVATFWLLFPELAHRII